MTVYKNTYLYFIWIIYHLCVDKCMYVGISIHTFLILNQYMNNLKKYM